MSGEREVFADTQFWIASTNPNDQWAPVARRIASEFTEVVTTDEVLIEFLGFVSKLGSLQRMAAVRLCRAVLGAPDVEVIKQSRESFLAALELYESRSDKGYSLVDCSSMIVMRSRGIRRVLTADHHFEQEGFAALMRG